MCGTVWGSDPGEGLEKDQERGDTMQLDTLANDVERIERIRRQRAAEPDEDDGEETMTYRERPHIEYLNSKPGVFDSAMRRGINTDDSVFDRSAVFRTGKRD